MKIQHQMHYVGVPVEVDEIFIENSYWHKNKVNTLLTTMSMQLQLKFKDQF